MNYRAATEQDAPSLKEMEAALMSDAPNDDPFFFPYKEYVGKFIPAEQFVVAERDDKLVGMLGAIPTTKEYWYVALFYVTPEARGNGVGRGLMDKAAEIHREQGRIGAFMTPHPAKMSVYERLGFEPVAVTVAWKHD